MHYYYYNFSPFTTLRPSLLNSITEYDTIAQLPRCEKALKCSGLAPFFLGFLELVIFIPFIQLNYALPQTFAFLIMNDGEVLKWVASSSILFSFHKYLPSIYCVWNYVWSWRHKDEE